MNNLDSARDAALKHAIRELRLPNLEVEPFVKGWQAAIVSHGNADYQSGLDRGWSDGFHAGLSERNSEPLAILRMLVQWCDENPPAGASLYFVELARNALARLTAEGCG